MATGNDVGLQDEILQKIEAELDALFAQAGDDPLIAEIRRVRREELIAAALGEAVSA